MDPEDTAAGVLSRLLALGLENMPLLIEEMLSRVHYVHDPDPDDIREAIALPKNRSVNWSFMMVWRKEWRQRILMRIKRKTP
jgi:hypothetical protein